MNEQFYQVGGSLPANAKSYIIRDADTQLYKYLKEGKYCYVLNARQVGKSSLRVHISNKLQYEGYTCINIDLTSIGSEGVSVDDWYFSFVLYIIDELKLDEDEFIDWWDKNSKLSVVNRFFKVFDKFILRKFNQKIIIFIDEIDAVLGIDNFSTDNFFAVIRTLFNYRSEDDRYNNLSFVLFGVATPEDLMSDSARTPFNIAHSVEIRQFVLSDSYALVDGLENQNINKKEILERIFEWTSGTPYLTQKILANISEFPIESLDDIDEIIQTLFIKENFKEINLSNIQNRIINNNLHNIQMLSLIKQLQFNEVVSFENCNLACVYLKLSGLAKEENGKLKYRNKIYEVVFNEQWYKRVRNKIDRPFIKELNKWLDSNRLERDLLRGKQLRNAKYWAKHNQTTNIESEFILHSSHRENRNYLLMLLGIFLIGVGIFYFYHKSTMKSEQEKGCLLSCKIEKPIGKILNDNIIYLKSIQGESIPLKIKKGKSNYSFIFPTFRKKIILLEVFGKDCGYCFTEAKILNKIRNEYKDYIQIISIQVHNRMSLPEANKIMKDYNIDYPIIEGKDAPGLLFHLEEVYGWKGTLPYILIIDNDIAQFSYRGISTYLKIKESIDTLLVDRNSKE